MTFEMLMLWPRPCSDRRCALFQPRPMSNSICTGYVRALSAVINQIRGLLPERGIIVRQGHRFLRHLLPDVLAKRTDVLSTRMIRIVSDLVGDWRQLDERIQTVTDESETLAKSDDNCRRVMTVPGIGPLISSAMVAAIGNGTAFVKGRDYSAWLGLVPRQMSTGARTIASAFVIRWPIWPSGPRRE
jgi:transposase